MFEKIPRLALRVKIRAVDWRSIVESDYKAVGALLGYCCPLGSKMSH